MTSSCIPTGLRLDLDMVKAAASPGAHSSPLRPVHSSPSSTLSEASNASSSATSVSLKRARAPRKRPNQAYNEAAALLASIHPSVFPVKKSPKTAKPPTLARQLSGLAAAFGDTSSDLLPPLPVLADAAFLLRGGAPSPSLFQPQPQSPSDAKNCSSPTPVSSAFREFRDPAPSPASPDTATGDEPGELDFDDDDGFDAESILDVGDEDAAEGIDGIMGSLTMEGNTTSATSDDSILSSSGIHPYLRSLMVVGLAGRFELGLGSRQSTRPNLNRALKRRDDDGAWWMWPAVPVKDITVAPPLPPSPQPAEASNTAAMPPPASSAPEKKKSKKKKVVKVEKVMAKEEELANAKCVEGADGTVDVADGNVDDDSAPTKAPKTGLGLKLDTDDVLKEWSGKGSMFAEGSMPESPESAAEVRAKLADIDLFPENGSGGIREARVMRYKEKRRNRLFSKKIRYQVRKVNADCRPRMKGRFVRSPSLLQQALEEEI
ncbi:protein CHLOROPLAST IMPORT APPARATUS 2 isoform X1 [Lolium perenne]|uniref:protein CHLOROPLAST IMPORT APPARATUS 2 isoform X1 n=1 Tax=Lolium perenne TaxID=4522 RepID=UPI0021EAE316|nr:protein CHLOROPLAST IMPORT APPARATUS 2-like isoform X1 [Lolium perenne]